MALTAVGAVIGRTATSPTTSYLQGAVALLVLLGEHQILSRTRFHPLLRRFTEHRLRILIRDGQLQSAQLRWCGLTRSDIESALRERGVYGLHEVRFLLYEAEGAFTVVRRDDVGDLIQSAVQEAASGHQ